MSRHQFGVVFILMLLLMACQVNSDDGDGTTAVSTTPSLSPQPSPEPAPYGIPQRASNTSCNVKGYPPGHFSMKLVRSFPNLSFSLPLFVTHAGDNSDRLFVVEQAGLVKVFPNREDVSSANVFLDIRDRVTFETELGVLGLAFHPDYEHNGYLYVNYVADDPRRTVISRFTVSEDPETVDTATELILLEVTQPFVNHNGGMLAFGVDGYLYIGMGDGGSQGDPFGNGQNKSSLLGDMLRIDVDNPSDGKNYGIPADNPFANATDGTRPEIYAVGMRNPWRFSFDRVTHRLWAGDVGQDLYEEIDIIENGKNYGWNVMEGFHCYDELTCDTTGLTLPLFEYPHSEGISITGGYVYRGTQLPQLYGKYIYADFSLGRIWALTSDGDSVTDNVELLDSSQYIPSFGETEAGELLVVAYFGELYHLEPATDSGNVAALPTRLSETGCFADVAAREPVSGVIGYDVNSPLYADDAQKSRFFAIPDGTHIGFTPAGAWSFPDGTVVFKDFSIEEIAGDPTSKRLLETRMLLKQDSGWTGYTYKWNEAQTDALLLDSNLEESYTLLDQNGNTVEYTHYYPSRYDCQNCHTPVAGYVLGLETGQMNRDYPYPATLDNQLRAFDHAGLFDGAVPEPYDQYARYPSPSDTSQPLSLRARSYLHANCSFCHRPGGLAMASMDLRYETPFEQTNTCNVEPSKGDLGVAGARLIKPGDASLSIVSLRMHSLDNEVRMPPLATSVVDALGTQVLDQWIDQLSGCE